MGALQLNFARVGILETMVLTQDNAKLRQAIKGKMANLFKVVILHGKLDANIKLHATICLEVGVWCKTSSLLRSIIT